MSIPAPGDRSDRMDNPLRLCRLLRLHDADAVPPLPAVALRGSTSRPLLHARLTRPDCWHRVSAWEQSMSPAAEVRAVESYDFGDLQIAYTRAGKGPPLVLLHGGLEDGRTWRRQVDGLAGPSFTVLAWDAPPAAGAPPLCRRAGACPSMRMRWHRGSAPRRSNAHTSSASPGAAPWRSSCTGGIRRCPRRSSWPRPMQDGAGSFSLKRRRGALRASSQPPTCPSRRCSSRSPGCSAPAWLPVCLKS